MLPKEVQEIVDKDDTSIFNDEYYDDEILNDWNYSTSCVDEYDDWEDSSC